jgi:hypothetical protein
MLVVFGGQRRFDWGFHDKLKVTLRKRGSKSGSVQASRADSVAEE